MAGRAGDRGTPYSSNILPTIVSTMVALLAVIGGFWSLADPRQDIKDIRANFLTLREHEEFVARVNKDIVRVEANNLQQDDRFQTLLSSRQTKEAADQATLRLEQRLTDLILEFRDLRNTAVEQRQLDGRAAGYEARLSTMQKQIEDLITALHNHIERTATTEIQKK